MTTPRNEIDRRLHSAHNATGLAGNQVKLVIWDLDDTLWKGTLSEEEVEPVQGNLELIKELSRRGIVNSICSKNDHEQAKALHAISARSTAQIFVLGCYTKGKLKPGYQKKARVYNARCRNYCGEHGDRFEYVEPDVLVDREHVIDNKNHFSREGYYGLARHIMDRAE